MGSTSEAGLLPAIKKYSCFGKRQFSIKEYQINRNDIKNTALLKNVEKYCEHFFQREDPGTHAHSSFFNKSSPA